MNESLMNVSTSIETIMARASKIKSDLFNVHFTPIVYVLI